LPSCLGCGGEKHIHNYLILTKSLKRLLCQVKKQT
jgi:hypothetical protein